MSNWRAQLEDESGVAAAIAWLRSYYHVIGLVLLAGFVLWNRAKSWGNFVVDGEILFSANDPWYHYRATAYAVEHFPNNIPFDPWTYFSYGTSNAQFGTIYDQTAALVALVVGVGNPSDELVRQVLLFSPVIVGAATLIPAYFIGRRVGGGRTAGLAAVTVIAFSTGFFMRRSLVGSADHHVVEAFAQALAVAALLVGMRVAEVDKPVYELLREGSIAPLRRTLGWGALSGIGVGLYLWVWPPGIFLIGIIAVFYLVYLSIEYLRGDSPEHLAMVGAVAMVVAGVMNLASLNALSFEATDNSLLQPAMAFGLAAWLAFVSWLARVWDDRDLNRFGYPATKLGVLVGGAAVAAIALPTLFGRMVQQVFRVLGFMLPQEARVGTVGETQPLAVRDLGLLTDWHGFAVFLALAGILIVLYRHFSERNARAEQFFAVVWIAFIFAAVMTQRRFEYYLVVPLATLAAVPVGLLMRYVVSVSPRDSGIQIYQVLTIVTVLLVIVAPMFVFANPIADSRSGAGPAISGWENSLDWMDDETPAVGTYDNEAGDELPFQGSFARTADFDYQEGDYGVVSWWDYGHWITALGERIPNANPFQQGAEDAARYLLSRSEAEASTALARVNEPDAETRYATVDWKMVESLSPQPINGKFFAPVTFHPNYTAADVGESASSAFRIPVFLRRTTRANVNHMMVQKQAYYETMAVRLYRFHGSAQEPRNIVVDWEQTPQEVDLDGDGQASRANVVPRNEQVLRQFPNRSAAEAFVEADGTAQIGGIGPYPSDRVPALQHWRLVKASDQTALRTSLGYNYALLNAVQGANVTDFLPRLNPAYGQLNRQRLQQAAMRWVNPSSSAWTKVFERVPGATVEGTGPPNTTVTARVQLQIPTPQSNFTYRQQARTGPDGSFEMTLPYSTAGYAAYGPTNGHTNVSVRATGPYTFRTPRELEGLNVTVWNGSLAVSEAAVLGEEGPLSLDLQRHSRQLQVSNGTGTGAGTEADDGGGGDGADGTATNGQGALAPPTIAPTRVAG